MRNGYKDSNTKRNTLTDLPDCCHLCTVETPRTGPLEASSHPPTSHHCTLVGRYVTETADISGGARSSRVALTATQAQQSMKKTTMHLSLTKWRTHHIHLRDTQLVTHHTPMTHTHWLMTKKKKIKEGGIIFVYITNYYLGQALWRPPMWPCRDLGSWKVKQWEWTIKSRWLLASDVEFLINLRSS